MVPYDEWKCQGMPFSYDKLTKKLWNIKKRLEKLTKILGILKLWTYDKVTRT